jgi:putative oxidoreductase
MPAHRRSSTVATASESSAMVNGFFAMNDGIELPLLYAAAAVALGFTGPGLYSLDEALGLGKLWDPTVEGIALAVGVVGALATLAVKRPAAVAR